MTQSSIIVKTPLEQVESNDVINLANKLQSSLTLTVFAKKTDDKLKLLVDTLTSSFLSDICFVDNNTSTAVLTSGVYSVLSGDQNHTITFLRMNKLIL
jgi:hypothetical protein